MATCPICAHATAEGQRFCPSCGTVLDVDGLPTGTAPHAPVGPDRVRSPGSRSPVSPASPVPRTPGAAGASPAGFAGTSSTPRSPVPRFVPGEVFAERYRIVGLLGRGGMGEVYRADDLRLGQAVALKFLPESLKDDPARRDRFYNEVRTARQVAHAAVCRVYDVADADGQPFLSMEYVDGEDLASLLRRIGRLPSDKALDIARQLCAGLAAAHERGVLHRDLKPDNVMLDGRGKVRITDFGLAGLAESFAGNDVRSGTPAYMSPEQLAGREVTTASDIYSLGLLLYELFTGRKAFEGRTLAELVRKQSETTPANPSTLVQEIDPAVEAVILRCLEKEPRLRPPSALAVAAALPGGDPLAAALAAGEIPSPEMVAAAGTAEGLRAGRGRVLLALGIAAMVLVPALSQRAHLAGVVTLVKPPAALEDRAQEATRPLAWTARWASAATSTTCSTSKEGRPPSIAGPTCRPIIRPCCSTGIARVPALWSARR
jgi:predicted Ser/Thr protein kinase